MPKYPGMIDPGTIPQMPGTSAAPPPAGATAQSHVEVPMILTSVPGRTPAPMAP
jgi:hypothetical protein